MTTILLIAMLAFAAAAAAEPRDQQRIGARIANQTTMLWSCQDKLWPNLPAHERRTKARYNPWGLQRFSPGFRAALLNRWIVRRKTCAAKLAELKRQWNWQTSLPPQAIELARCESSYNWWAEATSSDGSFYSAFNISRSEYDKNARLMGVRPWYVRGKGVPSPVEQWKAAIGHYRRWGDGWTGRCAGIMHE